MDRVYSKYPWLTQYPFSSQKRQTRFIQVLSKMIFTMDLEAMNILMDLTTKGIGNLGRNKEKVYFLMLFMNLGCLNDSKGFLKTMKWQGPTGGSKSKKTQKSSLQTY